MEDRTEQNWIELAALVFLAAIFQFFQAGPYAFFLFPWLLPVVLLRFYRVSTGRSRFVLLWAALWIATIISQNGTVPLPRPAFWIFAGVQVIAWMTPFWLDRRLRESFSGPVRTLILPLAAVSLEFLWTSFSPSASFGMIAYTQFHFSALIQSAAIFGIYGVAFLIYWFAAAVLEVFEKNAAARSRSWFALGLWFFAFGLILLYGFTRMNRKPPEGQTLRIASITLDNKKILSAVHRAVSGKPLIIPDDIDQADPRLREANASFLKFIEAPREAKFLPARREMRNVLNEAVAIAGREADRGAKLILFSEGQFFSPGGSILLKTAFSEFARTKRVFLFAPAVFFREGKIRSGDLFLKNRILIYNPEGRLLHVYDKARPVPGAEPVAPGDGNIPVIRIADKKVGAVICYDADYPAFMRQVGEKEIDILLIPSGDWKAISPIHTYMAIFRGIENGTSIVRQTNGGLSAWADSRGKIQREMDFFTTKERVLISEIKAGRVKTLYGILGDFTAYVSLAGIIIMGLTGMTLRKKRRLNHIDTHE